MPRRDEGGGHHSAAGEVTGRTIELFQDATQDWRWRVRGANGSDIVADSAEGYVSRRDAVAMAAELFPGLPIMSMSRPDDPEFDQRPLTPCRLRRH